MNEIEITEKDMELINLYSGLAYPFRLNEDDVFVFEVVLGDNKLDAEIDYMDIRWLKKLSRLLRGLACDDGNATIYDTYLEVIGGPLSVEGETYTRLVGKVYVEKNDKTKKLIEGVQSGKVSSVDIVTEFSSRVCSICGSNRVECQCLHQKGKRYNGELAYDLIGEPVKVCRWSFGQKVRKPEKRRDRMTQERAKEIERKVFRFCEGYDLKFDNANFASFRVGLLLGRMQEALHRELEREIDR